jgi:hypothetical protein
MVLQLNALLEYWQMIYCVFVLELLATFDIELGISSSSRDIVTNFEMGPKN